MKKILRDSSISWTRTIISISVFAIVLLSIQIAFFISQKSQAEITKNLVQSVLRQEVNISNSFLMARAITDLQQLDLITCTRLFSAKTEQTLVDLSYEGNCKPNEFLLLGLRADFELPSLNGELWNISFVIKNGPLFNFSLWVARLCSTILTFIGLTLLFRKFDTDRIMRMEKEIENQHLQNTVAEQELKISKISERAHQEETIASHAAQVAHDIKSPLSVISMLSTRIGSNSPEEAKLLQEAAKGIIKSAENLLANVRDRKTVNRNIDSPMSAATTLSNGINEVSASPISELESLCKVILEMKRVESKDLEANIRIGMYSNDLSLDKLVRYDAHQLKLIFSNIINNSIEAIPVDGFINLDLSIEGNFAIVEIRDSGRGIPENILKLLGQKNITYDKPNGNGLGLFNASKVIHSWDGKLDIYSNGLNGTTVRVSLMLN